MFGSYLDYNFLIMSLENNERAIQHQVDEIFHQTYGKSLNGRIMLAAYAIGEQVGDVTVLREEEEARREVLIPGLTCEDVSLNINNKNIPILNDFTAIKAAELRRDAALDGAQAQFHLSNRQAKKALRLAENEFWYFLRHTEIKDGSNDGGA